MRTEQKGTGMITLQMTKVKADSLSEIEDMSLATVKKALNDEIDADDEKVKVAVKMMGVVAKNRQTMTNRTAIEFGMASSIATVQQLERYVAATNPEIKKALGGK